jgi:DNA repair/transcription protein MET18/MMS19
MFTSDAALDLLSTISATSSQRVEELTLPSLFSALPDSAPSRDADVERQKTWRTLSFLGRLCRPATLFDTLVIRILAKVDLIMVALPAAHDREPGVAYIHALLHTLRTVLDVKVKRGDPDVAKHMLKLVPHLYRLFILSVLDDQTASNLAPEPRLVDVTSNIIGLIVQASPTP